MDNLLVTGASGFVGRAVVAQALKEGKDGGLETDSPSPPATATSDDSFDYLATGEASIHE